MFSRSQMVGRAIMLAVIFVLAALTEAQERAYLDATQAQIRQRQRDPATGSGGIIGSVTEGQKAPRRPLVITLKILSRSEIGRWESFEYEVQIQNASDQAIDIPWDLSSADIEPTDSRASYKYQSAAIFLNAKVGENRTVSMEGPILLFGALSHAGTMIKLKPGEWVRVKAKGRAASSNPNDAWPPQDLVSKQVEGTLEAMLIMSVRSFSAGTLGGSHEDARITMEPVSSNTCRVDFRF